MYSFKEMLASRKKLASGKLCHAYVLADEWITATIQKHAEFNHAIIAVELRNNEIMWTTYSTALVVVLSLLGAFLAS